MNCPHCKKPISTPPANASEYLRGLLGAMYRPYTNDAWFGISRRLLGPNSIAKDDFEQRCNAIADYLADRHGKAEGVYPPNYWTIEKAVRATEPSRVASRDAEKQTPAAEAPATAEEIAAAKLEFEKVFRATDFGVAGDSAVTNTGKTTTFELIQTRTGRTDADRKAADIKRSMEDV